MADYVVVFAKSARKELEKLDPSGIDVKHTTDDSKTGSNLTTRMPESSSHSR